MSNRSNVFTFGQKRFSERFSVHQVMMMVLPLLIIVLLPKVVNTNDPEMRKVRTCCYSEVLCKRYCIDINMTTYTKIYCLVCFW